MCMISLITLATISGVVFYICYFPQIPTQNLMQTPTQNPTAIVLTVESENDKIELFEGFTYSAGITGTQKECHKEVENENITCGNITIATVFDTSRKALSADDQRLVLLAAHNGSENSDALNKGRIKVFSPESKELQNHLGHATCLQCHHNSSNVCGNIISASRKELCSNTCSRAPKTLKAFRKEEIESFLKLPVKPNVSDWLVWNTTLSKYGTLQPAKVVCTAPKHVFETERTTECDSKSPNCTIMQLKCVGNDRWLFVDPDNCRHCQNDDDCMKINLGNKCLKHDEGNKCVKQRLLVGEVHNCETPLTDQKLFLLDPITLKLDKCELPQARLSQLAH